MLARMASEIMAFGLLAGRSATHIRISPPTLQCILAAVGCPTECTVGFLMGCEIIIDPGVPFGTVIPLRISATAAPEPVGLLALPPKEVR